MAPRSSIAACATALALLAVVVPAAQTLPIPSGRLPRHVLDVRPPSARVAGEPGAMTIVPAGCAALASADARRRIVDLALQEWAFFRVPVVEYTADDDEPGPPSRGRRRIDPVEAERVAASIGGYWSVTPGGAWILQNQNRLWRESATGSERWRYPWSAAFISWLMCEGGIGGADAFQRAIAHHTYIDQAIRARDLASTRTAYVAYDVGEAQVSPGDLLCTARRPAFRTLADRRRQLGQGARTHCDLVVKVDGSVPQILAVGGNVRGVVGLKVIPATRTGGRVRPSLPEAGPNARPVFAHLQLRGAPPSADIFDSSPVVRALGCGVLPAAAGTGAIASLRQLIGPPDNCRS